MTDVLSRHARPGVYVFSNGLQIEQALGYLNILRLHMVMIEHRYSDHK